MTTANDSPFSFWDLLVGSIVKGIVFSAVSTVGGPLLGAVVIAAMSAEDAAEGVDGLDAVSIF